MSNEEKINHYRNLSKEKLREILLHDEELTDDDIVIASFELGTKEFADGEYFTTEEVLENIFGKNYMVSPS